MLKVQGYFFLGIVLTPYLLQSWRYLFDTADDIYNSTSVVLTV